MKKIYAFLALTVVFCAFSVTGSLYGDNPFEDKDIYIMGVEYVEDFGSVTEINIRDGKVTVTIKQGDKITYVTEDDEVFEEKTKAKESDPNITVKRIQTGTVRVDPSSLNVRTAPWGDIVGSLYEGNQIKVIDRVGVWYRVYLNGEIRFLHANYVETPDCPAGQTPVVYPWQMDAYKNGVSTGTSGDGSFGSVMPCSPMPSYASDEYGYRTHPVTGEKGTFHQGIDLPVPSGTCLNALADGTVTDAGWSSGGGNYIRVKYDNGYESFYCHLQNSTVSTGARVAAGQQVAVSDNTGEWTTGSHLHFELRLNGELINPRDALTLP